jgi:cytochrome c551/c552
MNLEIIRLPKAATLLVVLSFLFSSSVIGQVDSAAVAAVDAEGVFNSNCASCHAYCPDVVIQAPSLSGVSTRWAGKKDLLYQWVKNPAGALATGDEYVQKLVKENKPKFGLMTPQSVTDTEIEAVLQWIDGGGAGCDVEGGGNVVNEFIDRCPEEESTAWLWLLVIMLILTVVIFTAAGVKRQLQGVKKVQEDGEDLPDVSYGSHVKEILWNNKKTFTVVVLVFVFFGARDVWYELKDVGVYGGYDNPCNNYAPEQPIPFSHRIHAGAATDGGNEINCEYCHHSASKSKHAGIPSANVCMNCHVHISEGKITGTEEIAKIYDAIDWDPEARTYGDDIKPIQWVKVHNLPDHVYFNHSQHVVVGGIECQTCHGEVEKTDVVEQHAQLTMGWCLNCHNETSVKFNDNGYYQEMHERLSAEDLRKMLEDDAITAREMGGWECAKCHY